MAQYTTPMTWTPGQEVEAAQLNAQLRDNMAFATQARVVSLHRSTAQSIAGKAWATVSWQVADYETVEAWSAGASPDRISPKVPGYYLAAFKPWWAAAAGGGIRSARIMLNGATVLHSDKRVGAVGYTLPCYAHGLVHLNGSTDYLQCQVYQDTNEAIDITITPGERSGVTLAWLGF